MIRGTQKGARIDRLWRVLANSAKDKSLWLRGKETQVVHPRVAGWLSEHGYTYEYEVPVRGGRIDFIATYRDGARLLVECKYRNPGTLRSAIVQVLRYQELLGDWTIALAIALPRILVEDRHREACERFGIQLIEVEI